MPTATEYRGLIVTPNQMGKPLSKPSLLSNDAAVGDLLFKLPASAHRRRQEKRQPINPVVQKVMQYDDWMWNGFDHFQRYGVPAIFMYPVLGYTIPNCGGVVISAEVIDRVLIEE